LRNQKSNSYHVIKTIFMNKADLINAVVAESGLSKTDAKKAIDAVVKGITDALIAGEKVSLVGFGTFSVGERSARTGINPATKETISIEAKKVAKFKAGSELLEAIN
jgi:DNA-binding protein HU-beta